MRAWIFFFTLLAMALFFETAFSQSGSSEDLLVPNLDQADAEKLVMVHSDEEARRSSRPISEKRSASKA
jgi:hypothetical protein